MPGTTCQGMPAAVTASISSSRRPNTVGSPPLSLTTCRPVDRMRDDQGVDVVLAHGGAEALLTGVQSTRRGI